MISALNLHLDQEAIAQRLPWCQLVDALEQMFCGECTMPARHHHTIKIPNQSDATLLLMPAWVEGKYIGTKVAHVFPANRDHGLPSISAHYLLSCAKTGRLLATLDGGELTARRTAAASVLAAKYLARKGATKHLMIGTGRLSYNLVQAYAKVLKLKEFSIWGINPDNAKQVASRLRELGLSVTPVPVQELDSAVAAADIISCATLSEQALIKGTAVKGGTHIDLVGGFKPTMREADNDAVKKSQIYIDTELALKESGDLLDPINAGILSVDDIQADLYALCRGGHPGRQSAIDITLFKSVGAACEDLAAAALAYKSPAQPKANTGEKQSNAN